MKKKKMGIFERFLAKGRTPILSFMCFSIAILLVGCNKPGSISESRSDSPKSNIAELKYLVLDGSPYNRGLVHGKTLKNEIREVVDRWNADIAKSSGMDSDTFIKKFIADFRFSSLEMRLRKAEELDIERIKSVLSAHDSVEYPVCLHYDEAKPYFTFGCTIMVLSESPELHIAPGPPDVTPFQIFRF